MEFQGYLLQEDIIINNEILEEVKEVLRHSEADVVFFRSVACSNGNYKHIDGFNLNASGLSQVEFKKLNFSKLYPIDSRPFIIGFVKKEVYKNVEALEIAINSRDVNSIDIRGMVAFKRDIYVSNETYKLVNGIEKFRFVDNYYTKQNEKRKKTKSGIKDFIKRSKKKLRQKLGKIYRRVTGFTK